MRRVHAVHKHDFLTVSQAFLEFFVLRDEGRLFLCICPAMAVASAWAARASSRALRTSAVGMALEIKAIALSAAPASWQSSVTSAT